MDRKRSIRVLIADPHAVPREGIAAILSRQHDMQMVGEASSAQELRERYRLLRPDIVVTELRFSDGSGREVISALVREFPAACILVLTLQQGDESIHTALQAGARGYLFKDASGEAIAEAVRLLHSGQKALNSYIMAKLVGRLQQKELTQREQEVLGLLASGKSNAEIGDTLFITEGTVKAHINSILSKLGVSDRTQATLTALQRGLVHLD